ncbi:MAG: hypothetical protein GY946_11680, partial [bacterium]|nr:hypothetical protein [bacterium]
MSPAPALTLTRFSLRHPVAVVAMTIVLCISLGWAATRVSGEVGYSAYFGPDHPEVRRLSEFLQEFDSGLHVL